mmetsp:Transcript_58212/g.147794  ORF Transcript_58212/g.147794 Transcript_58212/m.147794 type:complete len:97 (-) Transcript_58212:77-367(-)
MTGRGCCKLHVGVMTLHRATKDMLADPCNHRWLPESNWQCSSCFALHEKVVDDDDESDNDTLDSEKEEWCHICCISGTPLMPCSTSSAALEGTPQP